jgi:TetR/AcrR family transcriptional regulator, ethionamide resistance regulator
MSAPASRSSSREPRSQARVRLIAIAEGLVDAGMAFSAISVDRLTKEAGMPRTRFYNYFDDKVDLLLAWFDLARPEVERATVSWTGLARVRSRDELRAALRPMVDVHRQRRSMFAAMSEGAPTDARLQSAYEELLRSIAATLAEHVTRGQHEGWIDARLDSTGSSEWLVWGWDRNASMISDGAGELDFARSLDGFTGFVWGVLYKTATRHAV